LAWLELNGKPAMGFDELEWVRDLIDQWLTANGPLIGIALALFFVLATALAWR
jgi:hypothetical protein